jgi:hypothetical protein
LDIQYLMSAFFPSCFYQQTGLGRAVPLYLSA